MKRYIPSVSSLQTRWKNALDVPIIRTMTIGSLVASALSLAAIGWWWRMLPPAVPLWYSRAWGEDQLANPVWLWLLPVVNLLWLGISLSIASVVSEYSIFSKLILAASLTVSILTFITLLQIILIVT